MENPAQLTMTDMASLMTLIEVACSRGAYRAAEMTHVGSVYDRLKQFVDQNTAVEPTESATTESSDSQGESHA